MRLKSGASANFRMTIVPPSKSTPFCSPRVAIMNMPAPMTSADSASACQRQRMKSKFGVLKICMTST